MKILITGGSGYIGSSVQKRLGGRFSFVNFDIKKNRADDVRDISRLLSAVRGVDGVLHLAAISRPKWGFADPHTCLETNIGGTANVLEALRRNNPNAWIILGSSREVFGNQASLPATEESPRMPLNAYGVSKAAGEDLLKQYASNYSMRCLTLRFCGVYTGRNDILDRIIPKFVGQALRGEPITIEGDGKNRKGDYVYIDDVLAGIEKAIDHVSKKQKKFYDDIGLVQNKPISIRDLAGLIVRLTKSKSKVTIVPGRTYDQDSFWGSFAKAKKLLKWEPKIRLEDGLKRAIEELKPIAFDKRYTK